LPKDIHIESRREKETLKYGLQSEEMLKYATQKDIGIQKRH